MSQIETQAQQIGIFAIILIKAVEAGLFAEQRGVADKIEDQAQDWTSGSRLASQLATCSSRCACGHMEPDMQGR